MCSVTVGQASLQAAEGGLGRNVGSVHFGNLLRQDSSLKERNEGLEIAIEEMVSRVLRLVDGKTTCKIVKELRGWIPS